MALSFGNVGNNITNMAVACCIVYAVFNRQVKLDAAEFIPRPYVLPCTSRLGNLPQSQHRSIKVFGGSFYTERHSEIDVAERDNAKLPGVF
jgi:hypothetical protein